MADELTYDDVKQAHTDRIQAEETFGADSPERELYEEIADQKTAQFKAQGGTFGTG